MGSESHVRQMKSGAGEEVSPRPGEPAQDGPSAEVTAGVPQSEDNEVDQWLAPGVEEAGYGYGV